MELGGLVVLRVKHGGADRVLCCWQMEALQQQWDNTSAAMEALQQEDKRCRKHIGRLQQQTEVRNTMPAACTWSL